MIASRFKARTHSLAGLLLLLSTGCGLGGASTAEAVPAKEALHAALDAWKAGETLETLASRSTPIHVKDVDWRGGFRLVSYNAEQAGKLVGFDLNYPVVLVLKSPKGKSVRKTAVYTITTRPELIVCRQEG